MLLPRPGAATQNGQHRTLTLFWVPGLLGRARHIFALREKSDEIALGAGGLANSGYTFQFCRKSKFF